MVPDGSGPVIKKLRESKDLERCSLPGETVPHILARIGDSSSSPSPTKAATAAEVGQGSRASLRAQAGALYRKNATYQRRNICSNVCLLSAPIFFCLMLLAVQIAINKLLLTGADFEVRWQQQQQQQLKHLRWCMVVAPSMTLGATEAGAVTATARDLPTAVFVV
eukprot:GHUV01022633.1.p1 GENE.GHUV01022633.1~~GHUV01022633.1.p1  ORF type:complete len:165 (+),score=68.26 GHUV01022633.1:1019-1513(+)